MTITKECPVVWIQMASCSGCSVSVLNSVAPSVRYLLLDELVPGAHLNLRFQATIMAGSGEAAVKVLEDPAALEEGGYILVAEGAVPKPPFGTLGEYKGKHLTMEEKVQTLAERAMVIISLGTCASSGGIPAAAPNPTGARSVEVALGEIDKPLINIPGCPAHPDWFVKTLASLLLFGPPSPDDLDEDGRPKAFFGTLIHDNCPRRGFFDVGKFAKSFGDEGCLYKLGCKGPFTYADCPLRQWNTGVNWCVGNGAPCTGCVQGEYPDLTGPFYEKITMENLPGLRAETPGGPLRFTAKTAVSRKEE